MLHNRKVYIVPILIYITMKSKVCRINYRTLQKLRQIFPGKRGESVNSYFSRLQQALSEGQFVNDLNYDVYVNGR